MMKKFRILYNLVISTFAIVGLVACEKMESMPASQVSMRQAQNARDFYKPYAYNNCGLKPAFTTSINQVLKDSWIYVNKQMGVSEVLNFVSADGKKTMKFSFPLIFKENSGYFTYSHYNLENNSWNQLEQAGGVQVTGTIELAKKSYPIFITGDIFVRHDGDKHFIEMCGGNTMYRLNRIDVNSDFSMNLIWEEKR
jgi:hypothetical protein